MTPAPSQAASPAGSETPRLRAPRPAALVGIIANPASGKDIRRLVAHGSTFDNNEKINIVRRVLLGLETAGVDRIAYMPDTHAIVSRAAAPLTLRNELIPLPMPVLGNPGDSLEAARRLADLGAGCIVTLGGDGTNRVVAKGCGEVPLVAVSTGTNNVFPRMIEGTLAGLAAGLVASGAIDGTTPRPVVRRPWLRVTSAKGVDDRALIDVVTSRQSWVGARALWDVRHLGEIVLSRITAAEIGMASLGGLLFPGELGGDAGAHIVLRPEAGDELDSSARRTVLAPVAPGLLRSVVVERAAILRPGDACSLLPTRCTVALDGEREFEMLEPGHPLTVTLDPDGPWVVDIPAVLEAAARTGLFVTSSRAPATF
jgi:hypothetical protein